MKAAVVSSFDAPPRCQEFPDPTPAGSHEMVVDVIAAGLHPRVRSQADGSHYTSIDELPMVPGIEGVGRGTDGLLRYQLPALAQQLTNRTFAVHARVMPSPRSSRRGPRRRPRHSGSCSPHGK